MVLVGVPVSLPVADTAPAASAPCVFFALVGVHERSDLERRPGKFFPTPVIFRLILVLDVPMIVGSRFLRRGYCPTPLSAHRSDLIKAHPKKLEREGEGLPNRPRPKALETEFHHAVLVCNSSPKPLRKAGNSGFDHKRLSRLCSHRATSKGLERPDSDRRDAAVSGLHFRMFRSG